MWHAQTTSLTLRLYLEGDSYEGRDRWQALSKVELLGDAVAYLHATSRLDGQQVSRAQWAALMGKLRAEYGVLYALVEREGGYLWLDTATCKPAPVDLPGLPVRVRSRTPAG